MAMQDLTRVMNGVMWTQVILAIIFIAARMYTRYFLIHNIGWDDTLMVVNLVTFIGFVACTSVGTVYGVGKKSVLIPKPDYSKAIMWEVIGQGICIIGIAASKASVALFLLRIVIFKWHKMLLWFCIISTSILCLVTTILLFLQCKPAAYLWNPSIEGGVCWLNFTPLGITTGAWSAVMDFTLALLPWSVIMGLNMKRKEKLTVACGLSLGIFAGICSVIRTYQLQTLASVSEYVYDTAPMLLWSTTEILVTIICACIPVLRPLYVKIRHGSAIESSSGGRSYPLGKYSGRKQFSGTFGGGRVKNSGTSRSTDQSRVFMVPGASALQETVNMDGENASEESILREQRLPIQAVDMNGGGITRTDEILVTTSNAV